ncbi:MAG: glutamate--cysteine ligase [Burkholderiaceae bacterium]|nr:glutamate--cysteine ligase [Burkholderiaceae bacterium]MDP4968909.1 glutamate--cysteine ligase [Burkholderiaceae bacterium]MDP5110952.1 glutamate--cysteine ligase [Burkholderiaceae bacterium]
MSILTQRLATLQSHPDVLGKSQRGIEKEGLRVDRTGTLSMKPHPAALGSALTHPRITTDYSEALLELITGTHASVDSLMAELDEVHRVVAATLHDELMWNHSMPANLPADNHIPIGWYGTSNTGMLKHVYRRGLAERYGRTMQCIAGLHYNFSFDESLWELLDLPQPNAQDRRSAGYISLIRNFTRHSWLLMYLFGASPALPKEFLRGKTGDLLALDAHTMYLPYATSLRMSDLGYQSKAQSGLKLCYNDLNTFLERLYDAVTTPWPDYRAIGTHRSGEWIQLNTNILQIENEFYSNIRPKRTTGPCERPITALAERGIQYIEVRCLDIDPNQAIGISAETARFVDAFLLFCALQESPPFADNGWCSESAANFAKVVKLGRQPALTLTKLGKEVSLSQWADQLMDDIALCAQTLDRALGENKYVNAVISQRAKVADPSKTPSAQFLSQLSARKASFHDFVLEQSLGHAQRLKDAGLSPAELAATQTQATQSLLEQQHIEANDQESFDDYVLRFHQALKKPR